MKVKKLLAGKNKISLERLMDFLECKPDVEVVCASSTGSEVIEGNNEHQPNTIMIDTLLSERSDIEMIVYIHERLLNMNIMVQIHPEADADFLHSVKAGARAYISKDTSLKDLIKAVALVAKHGVFVSPTMASRLPAEMKFLEEHKGRAKLREVSLLTKREKAALSLVAQGLTNREIATSLFISEGTVKVHLRNIMGKLHARTRQHAVAIARATEVVPEI